MILAIVWATQWLKVLNNLIATEDSNRIKDLRRFQTEKHFIQNHRNERSGRSLMIHWAEIIKNLKCYHYTLSLTFQFSIVRSI